MLPEDPQRLQLAGLARSLRAALALREGQPQQALAQLEPLLAAMPGVDQGRAIMELSAAEARLALGDAEVAIEHLERAAPVPDPPAEPLKPLREPLTERELEVLILVAQGLSNREIARRLCVSGATIKTRLYNGYGNLGVHNRTRAVHVARQHGLLTHSRDTRKCDNLAYLRVLRKCAIADVFACIAQIRRNGRIRVHHANAT